MGQFHWKIEGYVWQSRHGKRGWKYGSESLRHLRWSQINTSWTVPKIKQNQVKVKQGSKYSKLKETATKDCSEKIPIEQIKDASIWHMRYWRVLFQESPKKKRPWHSYFPVKIAKFSKTQFFIEYLWWLLLLPVQYFNCLS